VFNKKSLLTIGMLVLLGTLSVPSRAQAQYWGGARIWVGGYWGPGFGYGYGCCYGWGGPWAPYAPWGWYGAPYGPYGYGYAGYGWASARIEIQPKTAEVFVDGSAAGLVNDFDSWYQSLNVTPGEHDIAIYSSGYKTQHYKLYFSPGSTQHIKGVMEKQPAGEAPEPRPRPMPPPQPPPQQGQAGPPQPPQPGGPPQPQGNRPPSQYPLPQYPPQPPAGPPNQEPPPEQAPMVRFGTLSLRVQPGDAEVLVDHETWTTAVADTRLSIKLSMGRHHIEVHKSGYAPYVEDILIRPDATMVLNIGLIKK
jgi:hypothetical protein